MKKTAKQLERYLKGVANHWRIEILELVANNEGITVEGIVESLKGNFKTISDHTRKLVQAGLINKRYKGKFVKHILSPYGRKIYNFLKNFE